MNRTHLECAAERLSAERGYAFHALGQEAQPAVVRTYPAALLQPLALRSVEGRTHGRAVYDLTLRLLCKGAGLSPEARSEAFAALEDDLLGLFSELSQDEKVIAVEALEIRPSAFTLTPHGELSQTASARIVTWF